MCVVRLLSFMVLGRSFVARTLYRVLVQSAGIVPLAGRRHPRQSFFARSLQGIGSICSNLQYAQQTLVDNNNLRGSDAISSANASAADRHDDGSARIEFI